MEGLGLCLSLLLEALDDVLVAPAVLVRKTLDGAVLAARLQSEDSESLGDDDLLLLVIGGGDALEELDPLDGSLASGELVREHASDRAEEDLAGSALVEGTALVGLDQMALVEEVLVAELADANG
jgi:hypothetical protein